VERGLREIEAVSDSGRDHDRSRLLRAELDDCAHALRLGAPTQIAEADDGPAERDRQVVVVADVDVDAPQDARVRTNGVPLDRSDAGRPLGAVQLRERATLVGVGFERMDERASRQYRGCRNAQRCTYIAVTGPG
jgi:hypothetical protein